MIIITTLLAAMILGFQDLFVFLRGGDSVIGAILNGYADKIDAFWETMKAIVLPWWFTALFGNDAIDKVAFKVADAVRGPDAKEQPTPYFQPQWNVSDFVSPGAASPGASAQAASSDQGGSDLGPSWGSTRWHQPSAEVHAPVTIHIHPGPGQSADDIGTAAAKHVREQLDSVIRQAAAMPKD